MNKITKLLILPVFFLSLSGCSLIDAAQDQDDVVDLGDKDGYVRWNLVENNNLYHPVNSAYFEFNDSYFKYYENDVLKKEGEHRIVYGGIKDSISQLSLTLKTGDNVSDRTYIHTFTEDEKEDIHQFTIKQIGYGVKAARRGGVPVRNYFLSEMPYAFGTYVKDGRETYSYKHEKVYEGYQGTFIDDKGNKFYLTHNMYKNDMSIVDGVIYLRYENNINKTNIEGALKLSSYEKNGAQVNNGKLYVMHGESEPSKEKGVAEFPDYILKDFVYNKTTNSISFSSAEYFDDQECDYNPANFIGGTYLKVLDN